MRAGSVWGDDDPNRTVKKTLYLANPYGFSAQHCEGPLRALVAALETMGADVWEAVAWAKPVCLFYDDCRRCPDGEAYPLHLRVFSGFPEIGWQAYWYGSLNMIADPDKARVRWLKDGPLL